MIFLNGHISGFVDELVDSLNNVEQAAALVEYEGQASLGSDDLDSKIGIPIVFIYLYSSSTPEGLIGIKDGDTGLVSELLKDRFNEAAESLNIKFYLANKRAVNKYLTVPGTMVLDVGGVTTETESYGLLEGGSYGFYTTVNTFDDGLAMGDVDSGGNYIRGFRASAFLNAYFDYNEFDGSKVLPIVLVNRLNGTSLESTEGKWGFMSGIHPAVSGFKHYYGVLPYHALGQDVLDMLDIEVHTQAASATTRTSSQIIAVDPDVDELILEYSIPLIKHFIGSMFGLLPTGVSSLDYMSLGISSDCDSTGCIMTGGSGDCVSSTLPSDNSLYFSTFSSDIYTGNCGEEATESGYYESKINAMNFFNGDLGFNPVYSQEQILKIRGGFATSGTVLHSLQSSFVDFVDAAAQEEDYCDNFLISEGVRAFRGTTKSADLSGEAESFNSIIGKIKILCNYIVYK